ncbi:yhhN family domain-containing protein [Phthorimaea operculella]|nr:yhhN family domain-containing protein [Phthorimaea operculella]
MEDGPSIACAAAKCAPIVCLLIIVLAQRADIPADKQRPDQKERYFAISSGMEDGPSIACAAAKCAPIVCLLIIVLAQRADIPADKQRPDQKERRRYCTYVALGLSLSAVGDALLVWPQYFVGGMGAFALAHVAYIAARLNPEAGLPPLLYTVYVALLLAALGYGLSLSAVGDALLVWPQYFVGGMGAFALAHVAYIAAFGWRPLAPLVAMPAFMGLGCYLWAGLALLYTVYVALLLAALGYGLSLSAVGDALLVWPQYFVGGMGAFALAHVAYIAAFGWRPLAPLVAMPAFMGLGCYLWVVRATGLLRILVPVYALVLVTMAWRGAARAQRVETAISAGVGGALFLLSDAALGYSMFEHPLPHSQDTACSNTHCRIARSVGAQYLVVETAISARVGGALFLLSDAALGYSMFEHPLPHSQVSRCSVAWWWRLPYRRGWAGLSSCCLMLR